MHYVQTERANTSQWDFSQPGNLKFQEIIGYDLIFNISMNFILDKLNSVVHRGLDARWCHGLTCYKAH